METPQRKAAGSQNRLDHAQQFKTLRISTLEGCVAMVMVALTGAFYTPFLHRLGATSAQIGFAFSLPVVLGGVIQLFTPAALKRFGSRKALVVTAVFTQALFYVPLAFTWLLPQRPAIWATIAAFSISSLAGGIQGPAWQDWMAVITPKKIRGRYFAWRNRIFRLIQLVVSVLGGVLLDQGRGEFARTMVMFGLIWAVCSVIRGICGILMALQFEPKTSKAPAIAKPQGFFKFIRDMRRTHYGRFTLLNGMLGFGHNLAAPFFAIFVLEDLGMPYTRHSILMTIVPTIAIIAVNPLFGRVIDRLGPMVGIKIFALGVMVNAFLWVVNVSLWWLFVVQVFAGVMWAGYALSAFSYSREALEPEVRVSGISYFNVLNSMAVFAGASVGGVIAPMLPVVAQYRLQSIFLLSGLMRLVPAILIQFLRHDRRQPADATALEKFLADPLLILRTGVAGRSPFARMLRRPMNE